MSERAGRPQELFNYTTEPKRAANHQNQQLSITFLHQHKELTRDRICSETKTFDEIYINFNDFYNTAAETIPVECCDTNMEVLPVPHWILESSGDSDSTNIPSPGSVRSSRTSEETQVSSECVWAGSHKAQEAGTAERHERSGSITGHTSFFLSFFYIYFN